jgi:hypothetical protein
VDDNACPTTILFFSWVTLTEHCWDSFRERRRPGTDMYEIDLTLPPATLARLDRFVTAKRLYGLTCLTEGGAKRCRFANKVRIGGAAHEQLSQFHPLIRFISEKVSQEADSVMNLLCIEVDSDVRPGIQMKPGTYAFAVQRWIFDGLRTEEAVRARVMVLDSSEILTAEELIDIVNAARMFGRDWPGATGDLDERSAAKALEDIEFHLIDDFNEEQERKESENTDRIQFQLHAIRTYMARKKGTEEQRIANLGTEPRNRGLVVAAERTIARLTERFNIQIAKFDQTSSARSKREPVGKGMILIKGSS